VCGRTCRILSWARKHLAGYTCVLIYLKVSPQQIATGPRRCIVWSHKCTILGSAVGNHGLRLALNVAKPPSHLELGRKLLAGCTCALIYLKVSPQQIANGPRTEVHSLVLHMNCSWECGGESCVCLPRLALICSKAAFLELGGHVFCWVCVLYYRKVSPQQSANRHYYIVSSYGRTIGTIFIKPLRIHARAWNVSV
jgi:hypothetical protein